MMPHPDIEPYHRHPLLGLWIIVIALSWVLIWAGLAMAHDAPTGWKYPFACCANYDCQEVPDASIVEGARGYEIRKTGELIPMSDKRVRQSPDGKFHWCAHQAGLDAGKTICLFVPPRSF